MWTWDLGHTRVSLHWSCNLGLGVGPFNVCCPWCGPSARVGRWWLRGIQAHSGSAHGEAQWWSLSSAGRSWCLLPTPSLCRPSNCCHPPPCGLCQCAYGWCCRKLHWRFLAGVLCLWYYGQICCRAIEREWTRSCHSSLCLGGPGNLFRFRQGVPK